MRAGALISDCGLFRYELWRIWDEGLPLLVFIMLNPSKADASINDPTIVKCMEFARRLGFGGILVLNLFAFRATDPKDLKRAGFPVGDLNDQRIEAAARQHGGTGARFVAAWGAHARKLGRPAEVAALLKRLGVSTFALELTPDRVPRHPLMLSYEVDKGGHKMPRRLVEFV